MQHFRRCTNNNIKKCLFHHLLEELLEAVWKCISPIAKFLIHLQVFYAWTYLNRFHPSSIHIQDAKHFATLNLQCISIYLQFRPQPSGGKTVYL